MLGGPSHQVERDVDAGGIEGGGRFVEEQDGGARHQRADDLE